MGADGRIKKPFERDDLVETVNKFLAQSEAALAPKKTPPPPQAPAEYEVQPMDEEPEVATRQEAPDFSAFSEGMAFGVPAPEEVPSSPADASPVEPMMSESFQHADEGAVQAGEVIESGSAYASAESEPMLVEDAAVQAAPEEDAGERTMMFRAPADIAQPMLSDEVEAAPPAEPMVEQESSEPAAIDSLPPVEEEVQPEPEPVAVEPPPAEAPAPIDDTEITPPGGTSIATQTLSGFSLSDAAAGRIRFGMSEPEVQQEPEIQHEPEVQHEPEIQHEPEVQQEFEIEHEPDRERPAPAPEPAPVAEAAVPERTPAEEVEYEVAPPGGIEIPPPQEAAAEEQAAPAGATAPPTEEAASPQESVAEEAAPPAEAEAPPPAEAAPPEKTVDEAKVSSIVHRVVVKMSPPAFSKQTVEDLARQITDEIIAELKSES